MTPGGLTLLTGGARSGKSAFAVEIGLRHDGPVVFIATATASDQEMEQRIERHRAERPANWTTVEEPVVLDGALAAAAEASLVIVDCLTLWVANVMATHHDDAIAETARAVATIARNRPGPTVVVTNEVGSGVHPQTALGRRYRDLLGIVNRTVADCAERCLLMVAGRAVPLCDPWLLLQ